MQIHFGKNQLVHGNMYTTMTISAYNFCSQMSVSAGNGGYTTFSLV